MTPLVTVIMPVFNAANYVAEAIGSILNQTYTNWELIIINDGSTDSSEEIIMQYSDRRVKYIRQLNAGVSRARNKGLEEMKGDFFCFLDADDTLPPDSISTRVSLFEDKKIDFVDGTVIIFNYEMTKSRSIYRPNYIGPPLHEIIKLTGSCFFGITWMVRRKAQIHYHFDETMSYAEDLWFFTHLAFLGGNYSYVPNSVYNRRVSSGSAMSDLKGLALGYKHYFKNVQKLGVASQRELDVMRKKIRTLYVKWSIRKFDLSILRLFFQLR
jgi:teichuronic acid biosynthesis glycosyltransferase TuaG